MSMEKIAAAAGDAAGAPRLFQLYVFEDREKTVPEAQRGNLCSWWYLLPILS